MKIPNKPSIFPIDNQTQNQNLPQQQKKCGRKKLFSYMSDLEFLDLD